MDKTTEEMVDDVLRRSRLGLGSMAILISGGRVVVTVRGSGNAMFTAREDSLSKAVESVRGQMYSKPTGVAA